MAADMSEERWPPLPYHAWKDTYQTLHMWMQIVGKIALASAPPLNHSWAVALQITSSGLSTRLLAQGHQAFSMAFDFVRHRLVIETSDGRQEVLPLVSRPVADFYREVLSALEALQLEVRIWPMPVEVPDPIRFDEDTTHRTYDPAQANRFWRLLVQIERVLTDLRGGFVGKASPAHFFWGSFDLALTRFSGRPAPPREGPAFMRDAYSHEVISHGFWPGNDQIPEPVLYAYAVPEPPGLKDVRIQPAAAYYHQGLGEFILPYDAVRASSSPEQAIGAFVDSTYTEAATLARWDRPRLERATAAQA